MTLTADATDATLLQPNALLLSEAAPTFSAPSNAPLYSDVRLPTHLVVGTAARETIRTSLREPVADFHSRPSKKFRAQLVEAGFRLVKERPRPHDIEVCHAIGESLEAIHAGSLIIDDIQDQSTERRGSATLHKKYDVPIALNTGNWLYFKSFELIRDLAAHHQLSPQTELRLYRLFHQVMLDAHVGQAIDIGAKVSAIEQAKVPEICLSSLRLKTGSLMALALGAGAVVAHASEEWLEKILVMGCDLGVSLQMFDDLGNLQLEQKNPKHFEDLYLGRPSWVWAAAAHHSNGAQYSEFLQSVSALPCETSLLRWLEISQLLPKARRQALVFSNSVMGRFESQFLSHHTPDAGPCSDLHSPLHTPIKSGASTGSHAVSAENDTSSALAIVRNLLERIQISYG